MTVIGIAIAKFRSRLSKDEKCLLGWAYRSEGHRLSLITATDQHKYVQVQGVVLNRDRDRWLLAHDKLEERKWIEEEEKNVYRLSPKALKKAAMYAHTPISDHAVEVERPAPARLQAQQIDPVAEVIRFSGITEDAVQLLRWAENGGVMLVHVPTAVPISGPRSDKWLKVGSQDLMTAGDPSVAKRWLTALDILDHAGYVREKNKNEYILNGKAQILLGRLKDAAAGPSLITKHPNFMKMWRESDDLDFYEYDLLLGLANTDFCIASRTSNGWFLLIGDNSKHWKDEPGLENGLKMKMVAQQLAEKGFLKPAYTPGGEKWELTPKGYEMSRVIGILGPR